jgi:hypothetical protein
VKIFGKLPFAPVLLPALAQSEAQVSASTVRIRAAVTNQELEQVLLALLKLDLTERVRGSLEVDSLKLWTQSQGNWLRSAGDGDGRPSLIETRHATPGAR